MEGEMEGEKEGEKEGEMEKEWGSLLQPLSDINQR